MNPFAQFLPTDFLGKLLFFFIHSALFVRPPSRFLRCCVDVLLVSRLMCGLGLSVHGNVFGSGKKKIKNLFVFFLVLSFFYSDYCYQSSHLLLVSLLVKPDVFSPCQQSRLAVEHQL